MSRQSIEDEFDIRITTTVEMARGEPDGSTEQIASLRECMHHLARRLVELESKIESGELIKRESAEWIARRKTLNYHGLPTQEITYSACSHCGQEETSTPGEAGIFCRRCGCKMINGAPGVWSDLENNDEAD